MRHHDLFVWSLWLGLVVAGPGAVHANPPEGMVLIPAGEFQMGDSFNEGNSDELPRHQVYVDAFYMDRSKVTNQQYADAMNWAKSQGNLITVANGRVYKYNSGTSYPYCDTTTSASYSRITWNGSTFGVVSGKENHPMMWVSWYGAVAYANWRSAIQSMPLCYDLSTWNCNYGSGYRLPTEAEWEKAARGGVAGRRFPWSDSSYIQHSRANYYSSSTYSYDNSPSRGYHPTFNTDVYPYTNPVDYFAPNDYGLRDMAGNAWDWCNDWYSSSYYGITPYPHTNPRGPAGGSQRVLRGGAWDCSARDIRCATRYRYDPGVLYYGFRLALSAADALPPAPTLTAVQAPSTVAINEPFSVRITLSNGGGPGDHGGISISFPDLTATDTDGDSSTLPYNSALADIVMHADTTFSMVRTKNNGDLIDVGGTEQPAQHLLVEGDEATWLADQIKTLKLTVTPKQCGTLKMRVRGWICATSYQSCSRAPETGGGNRELDQQQYWSEVLTVQVGPPVTPTTSLTVITHGYETDWINPYNDWPASMWSAIQATADPYCLPRDHFITDWVATSNQVGEGWAEAAGEKLFVDLMAINAVRSDLRYQFIGHSRGSSVNFEAIKRLRRAGISVDQMTTLDPVDGYIYLGVPGFGFAVDDPIVMVPDNVTFADNYYGTNGGLHGHSIPGAYNDDLGWVDHAYPHVWYEETVPTAAIPGYGYQLHPWNRPGSTGSVCNDPVWIFNGDFHTWNFAGYHWMVRDTREYVEGDHNVTIVDKPGTQNGDRAALFSPNANDRFATLRHQPIYVPSNAMSLTFDLRGGDELILEKLSVSFAGTEIWTGTMDGWHSADFRTITIPVHAYAGQVGEVVFTYDLSRILQQNWLNWSRDTYIDNIQLTTAATTATPTALALKPEDDTGTPGDGLTKLNTPRIIGQAPAGSTIRLYVNGAVVGTGTGGPTGFEVTVSSPLSDGQNVITTTAQGSGEFESSPSLPLTIQVDTQPPAVSQPDMIEDGLTGGCFLDDRKVSTSTPVFQGTVESGSSVTLYEGAAVLGSVSAPAGNWGITSLPLGEGEHQITAKAVDVAGNESVASAARLITIDLTPPTISDPSVTPVECWPVGKVFTLSIIATDSLSGIPGAWKPEAVLKKGATESQVDLNPIGDSSFQGTWNSQGREPGTYSVSFQAWDVAGNTETLNDAAVVCVLAACPADFDGDGDVDSVDFDLFKACASGPAVPYTVGCDGKDLDHDSDVDQDDFGIFQRCLSSENSPANPNCAN